MTKTLYICYFGLTQPLVQTQVLPYLRELAKGGIEVHLVTFESAEEASEIRGKGENAIKKELAACGIRWSWLRYHKRPSAIATAWDIFAGARFARKMIAEHDLDVLHGRVHVATLMGAIARKFSKKKPKLIFDIRGFFPEEYTDAGVWPENGLLYRATAKRVERWLMRESDGFVILTEKAKEMILADEARPVEVIPCCVDLNERFTEDSGSLRDQMRSKLEVSRRTIYTHVGALGGLYLTRELADFVAAARDSDPMTFAMFLTQSDPAEITRLLQQRGFSEADHLVIRVAPSEISAYLAAADAGLSFVKATHATQSRSPTKIPEYLAAGLPIIANSGVGDVDELIKAEKVGVLVDKFDRESYVAAITELNALGDIAAHCRSVARRRFDLETVGGARYRRLYPQLFAKHTASC